jgi:hypothetical protein
MNRTDRKVALFFGARQANVNQWKAQACNPDSPAFLPKADQSWARMAGFEDAILISWEMYVQARQAEIIETEGFEAARTFVDEFEALVYDVRTGVKDEQGQPTGPSCWYCNEIDDDVTMAVCVAPSQYASAHPVCFHNSTGTKVNA